jgi:hypothetical protein
VGGYEGRMRPVKLKRYINDFLLPSLGVKDSISDMTAHRWLKHLGFSVCQVQKGVYVDGHKRDDVVDSRRVFINTIYDEVLLCVFSLSKL